MTRCSVALADPADLMEAFQLLTSQESQDKLGYKIVRYKNKFEPKSTDTFKNIMVNALVRRVSSQLLCSPSRGLTASVCRFPFQRRRSVAQRTDVELVGELQLTTIKYCPWFLPFGGVFIFQTSSHYGY